MSTILDRIVAGKKREVEAARKQHPVAELELAAVHSPAPRDFFRAVTADVSDGVHLIAEIKRRSPSAGLLVEDFDPVAIAETFHQHGASALSVLTDRPFFDGRLSYIQQVKAHVPLPVLRKDFIIDEYQIAESRVAGADAVLLIAEVLGADRLAGFLKLVHRFDMTALVEVHTEDILTAVIDAIGPPGVSNYLLGINNRDLAVQRTDVTTTARLAALLPPGSPLVSESGIVTSQDVEAVRRAGACAILVGETLMRSSDVGATIKELLGR